MSSKYLKVFDTLDPEFCKRVVKYCVFFDNEAITEDDQGQVYLVKNNTTRKMECLSRKLVSIQTGVVNNNGNNCATIQQSPYLSEQSQYDFETAQINATNIVITTPGDNWKEHHAIKEFAYSQTIENDYLIYHMIVLTYTGLIFGWGKNGYNQVDSSADLEIRDPTHIKIRDSIMNYIGLFLNKPTYKYKDTLFELIASGSVHSIAVTKGNQIKIWGNNSFGQIGNGTYGNVVDLHDILVQPDNKVEMTPEENAQVIKARKEGIMVKDHKTFKQYIIDEFENNFIWHHIRVRRTGKAQLLIRMLVATILTIILHYIFKYMSGVLSTISTVILSVFLLLLAINFFERIPGSKIIRNYIPESCKIKLITCGAFHSFVLFENGNLWGWGSNERGQLGRVPIGCVLRPMLLFRNVLMVVARDKYSLVLCQEEIIEGRFKCIKRYLYTMGDNTFGQLGKFGDQMISVPMRIQCDYVNIGTINGMSFGQNEKGEIYAWGLYHIENDQKKKRKVARIIPGPKLVKCKSFNELVERHTRKITYHLVTVDPAQKTNNGFQSVKYEDQDSILFDESDILTVYFVQGDEKDEQDEEENKQANVITIHIGDQNKFSLIDDCNIVGNVDIKDVNQDTNSRDKKEKKDVEGILKKVKSTIGL